MDGGHVFVFTIPIFAWIYQEMSRIMSIRIAGTPLRFEGKVVRSANVGRLEYAVIF